MEAYITYSPASTNRLLLKSSCSSFCSSPCKYADLQDRYVPSITILATIPWSSSLPYSVPPSQDVNIDAGDTSSSLDSHHPNSQALMDAISNILQELVIHFGPVHNSQRSLLSNSKSKHLFSQGFWFFVSHSLIIMGFTPFSLWSVVLQVLSAWTVYQNLPHLSHSSAQWVSIVNQFSVFLGFFCLLNLLC